MTAAKRGLELETRAGTERLLASLMVGAPATSTTTATASITPSTDTTTSRGTPSA